MGKAIQTEFQAGDTVIYSTYGKCLLASIENKNVGNEVIPFYKLEIQRSTFSRSAKQDPAIWVPVSDGSKKGLRSPMTSAEAEVIFQILSNQEYYFSIDSSWGLVHPQLETTLRGEGAVGLAKVFSYLFVVTRKQIVPPSTTQRFFELIQKLLVRELSEAWQISIRATEEKIHKAARQKLNVNH